MEDASADGGSRFRRHKKIDAHPFLEGAVGPHTLDDYRALALSAGRPGMKHDTPLLVAKAHSRTVDDAQTGGVIGAHLDGGPRFLPD